MVTSSIPKTFALNIEINYNIIGYASEKKRGKINKNLSSK
jgi:hypothetical protein